MQRILILGGTLEARRLAEVLAGRPDYAVTLSLAGRTTRPAQHAVPVRSGGFGGANGLADYLRTQNIDVLIDATHPYAAIISGNAARAAEVTGVALLALRRPPWIAVAGDRRTEVADAAEAVRALGQIPRRVFVAIGRQEVAPFERAPQHYYLVRSVEPIDPRLNVPHAEYIVARGPFSESDDRTLFVAHGIDTIVAKNSGGTATYGKIAAARALGIEVVMLRRPTLPQVSSVASVAECVAWLDHAAASPAERGV
jgi:precorrin-6A/cobalt-precorrin-6A reductase